jgi:hypothetical protein
MLNDKIEKKIIKNWEKKYESVWFSYINPSSMTWDRNKNKNKLPKEGLNKKDLS